jgi:hypothetical protein
MLHELGRQGTHAAAPARGAEPPPLARERHDHLVRAARAAHVDAPVFQEAAAEIGPKLSNHEGRQAPTVGPGGAREEGVQMRLEGAVEDGALRLAALIGRQGTEQGHAQAGCSRGAWVRSDEEARTSHASSWNLTAWLCPPQWAGRLAG